MQVYIELVRSIYVNTTPAKIMAVVFSLTLAAIYLRAPDRALLAIGGFGLLTSFARIWASTRYREEALTSPLDNFGAKRLERALALPTLAFAACLGAFGAKTLLLPLPAAHMLVVCLLTGYCAGVATIMGLRPKLAIGSMAIALTPAVICAVLKMDILYVVMAGLVVAFFAGGTQSILLRSTAVRGEIGKRLTLNTLAKRDGLTALPNRWALREFFEDAVQLSAPQHRLAVHYLDLDGFKPINDRYGHRVGDALLAAVAERLNNAIRTGDIVARLGGDEFAILQLDVQRPADADFLSQRVVKAIRQPFNLEGARVAISASIGSAVAEVDGADLDELLAQADQKLYAAKRARSEGLRLAA